MRWYIGLLEPFTACFRGYDIFRIICKCEGVLFYRKYSINKPRIKTIANLVSKTYLEKKKYRTLSIKI